MSTIKTIDDSKLNLHPLASSAIDQRPLQKIMKRGFDIVFSFLSILFFSPFLLLIALAVKTTSVGPVLYKCPRIGRNGKIIQCLKFRSMYKNADEKLSELLSTNPELKEEYEVFHKLKNDPRITRIGKWLRKTSLDELPQFFNVLNGDLSVVGPRPYAVEELPKILEYGSASIFTVRPGITGIWQTSGRNLLSFEQRIRLEETYINSHSIIFDLKLILKTIPLLILPKGAY